MHSRLIAVLILCITTTFATAQDATEIVQKSLDVVLGESNKAEMRMTIVRPTWKREIEMKSWSLGTEYSLVLITAPARDKGTAFLKRHNELWNWQPRIERTIKLPPSMMLQSWMGSDFTNDDLVRQSSVVEDYTQKLLGEETIEGRACYIVELLPREEAAVVWGKVIAWISKGDYLTMKEEFYDEDGYIVNTIYGKQVQEMDGRLLPAILEVVPADEEGHKTVIEYLDIDWNIPLETSFFSIQNMKRAK